MKDWKAREGTFSETSFLEERRDDEADRGRAGLRGLVGDEVARLRAVVVLVAMECFLYPLTSAREVVESAYLFIMHQFEKIV